MVELLTERTKYFHCEIDPDNQPRPVGSLKLGPPVSLKSGGPRQPLAIALPTKQKR
jgi:hypothetical protein